jgi:hypothetical protein
VEEPANEHEGDYKAGADGVHTVALDKGEREVENMRQTFAFMEETVTSEKSADGWEHGVDSF